jgi:hypothetical protein
MNYETPVNGATTSNDVNDFINGIDNGICTVTCVSTTTSVDAAGDYRITRSLECIWNNSPTSSTDGILDLEIAGAKGAAPVATLNGQLLPNTSVLVGANGFVEIRNIKGMLLDRVQLPCNATAPFAGNPWQAFPYGNNTSYGNNAACGSNAGYGSNTFDPMSRTYAGFQPPFPGSNGYQSDFANGIAQKPTFGISIRPLTGELAHHLAVDARNACVVSEVLVGSPAFTAGLETNDIIISVNGKQAGLALLRHELMACKPGQTLTIVKLGKGVKREIKVVLDAGFSGNLPVDSVQYLPFQGPGAKFGGSGNLYGSRFQYASGTMTPKGYVAPSAYACVVNNGVGSVL